MKGTGSGMFVFRLKSGGVVSLGCGRHHATTWKDGRLVAFEVGFPPVSWRKTLKRYQHVLSPPGGEYDNVPVRLVAACIKQSGGFTDEQAAESLPPMDIHLAECLAHGWMFFSSSAQGG